jgi:hypothetical protein
MGNLATTYHCLGKFHNTEELEVVVLEKRKQVLGSDHPDTLQAMVNLTLTYNTLSKFHNAQTLEVAVVEKRKKLLGDNHPDTLQAMWNLALTYRSLDNLAEAEKLEQLVHNIAQASECFFHSKWEGSYQKSSQQLTKL